VLRARACMCVCVCVCEREREFFTTKIRPEPGGDQPDSLNFFHSWIADARRVPLSLSLSLSLSSTLCLSDTFLGSVLSLVVQFSDSFSNSQNTKRHPVNV